MRKIALFVLLFAASLASLGSAQAATWTTSTTHCPNNLQTMLQLRDGRLLISNDQELGIWLLWTPDKTGSYEKGSCTRAADMPPGYGPRAFGSLVLPSGKVYVCGGEYNLGKSVWTNLCAMYTPDAGKGSWAMFDGPPGWYSIGDAPALLLPNGKVLQLNCCTNQASVFDPATMTWTPTGNTLIPHNHEVLTILLQSGLVMMMDTDTNVSCGMSNKSSEIWNPATGQWTCGPQLPMQMWGLPDNEGGPGVVLPDGRVFQTPGGFVVSPTALMNPVGTQWSVGTDPQGFDQDDSPTAELPDGTVLGLWRTADHQGCQFKIFDPATGLLNDTINSSNCPGDNGASAYRLTVLSTGQVALATGAHTLQFYNPGTFPLQMSAPRILAVSGGIVLRSGLTYILYGSQLNGLSCASVKDDDSQQCTNYPLLRMTDASGNVTFAPTHDDSYSGIAPGTVSFTKFDIPPGLGSGVYTLAVVTNGISSNSVKVSIR